MLRYAKKNNIRIHPKNIESIYNTMKRIHILIDDVNNVFHSLPPSPPNSKHPNTTPQDSTEPDIVLV